MRSLGLKMGAPLFYDASNQVLNEKNYESVEKGLAGNLILLEGLRSVRPQDPSLTATLIKGFVGYAFAINETYYLNDKFMDIEESIHKKQAIFNYSKALRYGEEYLLENDLTIKKLESSQRDGKLMSLLNDNLSENDETFNAIFFTAQALASLINLQRDKMAIVAKLPVAKGLFDWVCEKKPLFNNGACDIFYSSYEAGRPKMLGGDPEKGKMLFLKAMKKWPNNLLVRESFLEYYSIPMSDEKSFNSQVEILEKANENLQKELTWGSRNVKVTPEGYGLYNSIALRRFKIMKKYKKELF